RGDLQFVVDFVRPEGVGIMAAKFEELRERLEREGLFELSRKRPLPRFPQRIGLVTSPAGAALHDVRTVIERRWPLAEVLFVPAMVQGSEAPGEIAAALRALAREPGLDVAILARGGGSAEDLSAFNSEPVARAIYAFPVPLVSGVGHETDVTIADMVADLRAPTPSAAAERVTPDSAEVVRNLAGFGRWLHDRAAGDVQRARVLVDGHRARMERALPDPATLRHRVDILERACRQQASSRLVEASGRVERAAAQVSALDPMATLARGFAIVQHVQKRKVVSSVRGVRPGDRLSVAVHDGAFWTEVS
ncbi:MAG: exodeoxyribonuclease VII large subunit, partial [Dehalococcoidia bacterium]